MLDVVKKTMGLRLLKCERAFPPDYLAEIVSQWKDVRKLTRAEYLDRVLKLRLGASDNYVHGFRKLGWVAEEFLLNDTHYYEKIAKELYSIREWPHLVRSFLRSHWRYYGQPVHIVEDYVRKFKPDVIFVRVYSGVPTSLWQRFRKNTLLVNYIACDLPAFWGIRDWDVLLTMTPEYKTFFELHRVPTYFCQSGFDRRVLDEVGHVPKIHDVTFIGNLGGKGREERTRELNEIAGQIPFQWWGIGNGLQFPSNLEKTYQGVTGGLEMYRLHAQTRIALNAYSDIANRRPTTNRIYEVMGMGTFLLSKRPDYESPLIPRELFITFDTPKDCVDKIAYYLKNEKEREQIAKAGQEFVLKNCTLQRQVDDLSEIFTRHHQLRFGGETVAAPKLARTG